MAFDLSTGFDTLTLRPDTTTTSQTRSEFTLFTTLPIELRLKIISHTLPSHRTLHVKANVLVADPDFGLYVDFHLVPPALTTAPLLFGGGETLAPRDWYVDGRALPLLLVNHEFRDCYIENFPYSLPSNKFSPRWPSGKIRFSPEESIEIRNYTLFAMSSHFAQAREEGWKLPKFFTQVEKLIVPLDCPVGASVDMLKTFTTLKVVKAELWKHFGVGINEDVKMETLRMMKRRMDGMERVLQSWKEENEGEYVVPKFELV